MVTCVEAVTGDVEMLNTGEDVAPAGTRTEAGTVASVVLEELKLTVTPEGPAGPSRVTRFAVVVPPLPMLAGDSVSEYSAAGRSVRFSDLVDP